MEKPSDRVVIGVAAGAHGARGTLRVRATGSGRHLREGAEPFIAGRRRRILRARQTPKGFLLDLEDVNDRSDARALAGAELVLDRSELDANEEDEFYVADLVGLAAQTEDGRTLGRIRETFETRAHEVLVIGSEEPGASGTYVPFTFEHVPEVDLEVGHVVVRLPEEEPA